MANQLVVEVLTPNACLLHEAAEEVVLPIADGWVGILPGHSPFEARLLAGEILITGTESTRKLATLGGTVATDGAIVRILTGVARLDAGLDELRGALDEETARVAELEREAERHFDRVYRSMAHTLRQRGIRRPS